ncbi:MAG TPA: DsbA family protein [Fibrobacteria bacterium]|nr:DsbA family protein [Fibrobacteria bacterium]
MIGEAGLKVPTGPSDHAQGPAHAPVELVEYGDYQCPSCGKGYPIVKRVQRSMNGVLRFAFRNFPLTQQHPDALNAAKAAEAAGMQGRYWQMHDLLFENQEYLDYESLLQYAVELRIDVNRFARDFRSPKVEKKILSDFESGVRSGVNGTPTFFINGFRYDGDWSYYSLMQALQAVAAETQPV